MGMAQRADTFDQGETYAAPLVSLRPSRIGEALRLAVVEAESDAQRLIGGEETLSAIEHIREAADWRRSAEARISDLEDALDALRASTRRDLTEAQNHAEQAKRDCSPKPNGPRRPSVAFGLPKTGCARS